MVSTYQREISRKIKGINISRQDSFMAYIPYPGPERMEKRRLEMLERREKVSKIIDTSTYNEISKILFKYDPINLNFESNTDEYDSEADYIVIRFQEMKSVEELEAMIKEVFIQMFDEKLANTQHALDAYKPIASEIWALMSK